MATSLAEQLKRLAIPQTKVLLDSKERASLLFDPSQAAKLSREAVWNIAQEGLNELLKVDPSFTEFKGPLFSNESKFVQRAIETKDVNKKLDKMISRFFIRLSPYLLMNSAHKVLEWMIFRYRVHEMNASQLFALILPYNEANIFVKVLQLIDLKSSLFKSWTWLEPLQKHGLQLTRQVLVNHAISDTSFLRFICESTEKALKEHRKTGTESKLRTQLAFYTSSLVGIFSRTTSDQVLTVALPSMFNAVESSVDDYKAASYMAFGQLISNTQLETDLALKILTSFMEDQAEKFQNQRVYLLLLMFQRQEPPPCPTYSQVEKWDWVVPVLAELANDGTQVGPLVTALLTALLDQIVVQIKDNVHDASPQVFSWGLLEQVQCDDLTAGRLLKLLVSYHEKFSPSDSRKRKKSVESNTGGEGAWLKTLIETFCAKYAATFESSNDSEVQSLRRQWSGEGPDKPLDGVIMALVRKCSGPSHAEAWRRLKPLLFKQIDDKRYFKAWCKASPATEPVTLIIILERLLRPTVTNRKQLLSKVGDSTFGSRSLLVSNLKASFDVDPETKLPTALENMMELWKSDANTRFPTSQWISAINEAKNSGQFSSSNHVWSYLIRMLIYTVQFNETGLQAVEIGTALGHILSLKSKKQLPIITEIIQNIVKTEVSDEDGWFDLSRADISIVVRIKVLEVCLQNVHKYPKLREGFAEQLDQFLKTCFPNPTSALGFISAVSAGLPYQCYTSPLISPKLQIYALHYLWTQILSAKDTLIELEKQLGVHILMALENESMSVREAAMSLSRGLVEILKKKSLTEKLLTKLIVRSKEIIADANHVTLGLHRVYTMRSLEKLTAILISESIPLYVAAKLAFLTVNITSEQLVINLAPLAQRALASKGNVHIGNAVLASYWQRVTAETSSALDNTIVWGLAKESLAHHKCDDLCPAITFIKIVNKEFLASVDEQRQRELIELLVGTRAETESPAVSSAVASAFRKVPLSGETILPLVTKMITLLPKEKNSPGPSLDGRLWRQGLSLLEIIQGKKKLSSCKVLVAPLLAVLKYCLDQEEQTPHEYAKQLVLGCLMDICERHVAGSEKVEPGHLDVQLIVQCLRASSNPQTHHHALLLLSCLGSIIPMQVMHNMMAIFTFMGSSVARLDDEHSVQVVTKVVDAIVPVLVQSLTADAAGSDAVVAEVLRIFVWTLRDVPQHRRVPLFTRLISTLDADRSLWIFLLLLFENYVVTSHKEVKSGEGNMPPSLQLGMELALSFGPKVVLNSSLSLIRYLVSIPLSEMDPNRPVMRLNSGEKSNGLFDIKKHTPKQLRHYTYTLITFLSTMLSDQNLILQVRELDLSTAHDLESIFKDAIAALLLYAPTCAAQQQIQLAKYWKVMTSLSYDVLDRLVALVSSDTLVGVITRLLNHTEDGLRRKAVDLLNVHVQTHRGGFTPEEKASLTKLVPAVLTVATAPGSEDGTGDTQTIQQVALLSLRLLAKVLASDDPQSFKEVLVEVSKLCKGKGNVLASAALTVADLVAQLKARSVSELHSFLPAILKALNKYIPAESTDIVLMSLCAAVYRVVESLGAFLSPYMDQLNYCVACLATRWPDAADLNRKLVQIRQRLASNVAHRILIPSVSRVYKQLIEEGKLFAVGPLFSLLSESLPAAHDVSKLLPDVTPFLMQALQLRSDAADGLMSVLNEDILQVEGYAIDALLTLVLKLSEHSFKPVYYQIFHWASEHPHRAITFYRLSSKLAEGLKGLFVLFAGHFLQNAATLLDSTNLTKNETPFFGAGKENEEKAALLLESIVQTLYTVFLFDSTQFLSKEKFQALLSPLVDQLDNPLGGPDALDDRSKRLLTPCIAQMALSTDDTQWKQLNYQLLSKTRSSSPLVRIAALQTIVEMVAKLKEEYLPLLPETIGTLAELLEDDDERVENAMKEALRRMEDDLGQNIREYFQ